MANFKFKNVRLYKDKGNKKWCVRYSIRYAGQNDWEHLKEYGRYYFGKSLNSIEDDKIREKEFQKLLLLVERDLEEGIDIKRTETVKAFIDEKVKEAKKHNYDENFELYMKLKSYVNPIPKKVMSAKAYENFHKTRFRPFLEKKGLLNDISQITKTDIQEFFNIYYLNSDPKLKWSNNTFNIRKGYLSSFFSAMVDEDIISENPVTKMKNKEAESTERFAIFTKEERDILFKYLDEKQLFIGAVARLIYYAYIRETELARLMVSDFDLEKRRIRIHPDIAKGSRDKMVKWVSIALPLKEALKVYLEKYENQPEWFMFGKKHKPSKFPIGYSWQYHFKEALEELKINHPDKFNRPGLSLYCMKHSGVTHFINDNSHKSSTELLRYVQVQCRHQTFEMTQRYLKKLEINIEMQDTFNFD